MTQPAHPSQARPRGAGSRALAVALCLLAVVAAELVTRAFAPFRLVDGEFFLVTSLDGERGILEVREVDGVPLWTRAHEGRAPPRPQKTGTRIVVLGDSVVMPAMVPDAAGAVARVERLLRDSGRDVELVNLSEGGYSTVQEEKLLSDQGLALQPDVVLVAVTPNDIQQFIYRGGHLESVALVDSTRERGPAWAAPVWRRAYLYNLVWFVAYGLADRRDVWMAVEEERRFVLEPLQRMAAATEAAGARFAIVCSPSLFDDRPDRKPVACAFGQVERWARSEGIAFLSPDPAYARYPSADIRLDHIHLNELGHRILAEELLRWFDAEGLVPPPTR